MLQARGMRFGRGRAPLVVSEGGTRKPLKELVKEFPFLYRRVMLGRTYACFLAVLAAPQSEPGLTRSG